MITIFEHFVDSGGQGLWGSEAGGILIIAKSTKRFLIAFRSPYVHMGRTYGIVGGKLDDHETDIKDAVIREFDEETGYSGYIELFPAYVFKTTGFKYHNFIGIIDEEFEPETNWETEYFKWVSFDELLEIEPKHFGLTKLLNDKKSLAIIKQFVF